MNFKNKQEFPMKFYNKREYSMKLCNFQQFLKISKINKYLLRIPLLNKNSLWISRIIQQIFLWISRINKYLLQIFLNKQSRNISTNLCMNGACWWRSHVGEWQGWREVPCLRRRGSRRLQKYQTNEIVY
jgi:hypothetical protein